MIDMPDQISDSDASVTVVVTTYNHAHYLHEALESVFRQTHESQPIDEQYDRRTIKGGGWDNLISRLRVSERAALSRRGRHNLYVGFRCVRPEKGVGRGFPEHP